MDSLILCLNQTPALIQGLRDRLDARTIKGPDCWEIQGAAVHGGYVHIGVYVDGKQKLLKAHRVAWALANGPIPEGMRVMHACDNPRCVNLKHLTLGSQADNIADAVAKGRFSAWHRTGVRLNGQSPKTRLKAIQPDAQPNHDLNKLPDQQRRAEFVHE